MIAESNQINQFDEFCGAIDDKELENISATNANNWLKNAIELNLVKYIPYNELTNMQPLDEGNFGSVYQALWRNNYIICKRLINGALIRNKFLKAFIQELQMQMQLAYSERFIKVIGISQATENEIPTCDSNIGRNEAFSDE
ncbi:17370_t:CDS:2, partial [Dentiscutata erythropus]